MKFATGGVVFSVAFALLFLVTFGLLIQSEQELALQRQAAEMWHARSVQWEDQAKQAIAKECR